MSEADFEVIRQAWAAFSSGDVEAQLLFLDPDVEIVPFGASMEGKSYRGHDGVRHWFHHEIDPNWTEFRTIPEEFRRVDHRILVFGQWIASGRTSGVRLNVAATWIVEVQDGKIVRWQTYTDRDEALQALRIRPFD
jgi:ketosteroid isomerase-like protein